MRSVSFSSALLLGLALAACGDDGTGTGGGSPGAGGSDGSGGDGGGAAQTTATGSTAATTTATTTTGTTSGGQGGEGGGGGQGGQGGDGQGGQGGEGEGGEGGGEPNVDPCPGQFECSDDECVHFAAFCDGVDDCVDGQDEVVEACGGFIDGFAVCDSGISFGSGEIINEGANLCASAACCDEFRDCTGNGSEAEIDACIDCFIDGGGPLCDAADACLEAECPGGGSGVCDTTLTFSDVEVDACLSDACCEPFQDCIGTGSLADVEACIECFNAEVPGALCAAASDCADQECPPEPAPDPAGICDTGLTTGEADDDDCLSNMCCTDIEDCLDDGQAGDVCLACLNAGGGAQCDDAIDCANTMCP